MCAEANHDEAHELLALLASGAVTDDVTSALLSEFQRGFPVANLEVLLRSDRDATVTAGIWIASELGVEARPLLEDVVALLHHPVSRVRFFALDCLVSCAGSNDGEAVTQGLDLVEDREPSVRWKALVFLATIPEPVLRGAVQVIRRQDVVNSHEEGIELVLNSISGIDANLIVSHLAGGDAILRSYGAAAAARVANRDTTALKRAMESQDKTIRQFAYDMAERLAVENDR